MYDVAKIPRMPQQRRTMFVTASKNAYSVSAPVTDHCRVDWWQSCCCCCSGRGPAYSGPICWGLFMTGPLR